MYHSTFWHYSKTRSLYIGYSHVLFLIAITISQNIACHILRTTGNTNDYLWLRQRPIKHHLIRPWNSHPRNRNLNLNIDKSALEIKRWYKGYWVQIPKPSIISLLKKIMSSPTPLSFQKKKKYVKVSQYFREMVMNIGL